VNPAAAPCHPSPPGGAVASCAPVGLPVIEKSLESEFPGIAFRDSLSGREAYLSGHRIAVWEVLDVHGETRSIAKTAAHFGWPAVLVRRALAYARAFPEEIRESRDGETGPVPPAG
jgi:uncharacterized protein (DUF433 family)